MTIKQLLERKFYVKRAILFKIYRIPNIWRLLGEKHIPKVKGADGKMISFGDAVAEALEIYGSRFEKKDKKQLREDMIKAWYKNTVTPEEYFYFGFPDFSQRERDTFVSRKEKDLKMCLRIGLGEDYLLLKDKYKFYNKFKQFFKRDVCLVTKRSEDVQAFREFLKAHSSYIAKLNKGHMGIGTVIRFHDKSDEAIKEEIDYLLSNGEEWVVEELIRQEEHMASLNASSINTVRVCSRWNPNDVSIFETVVRMGKNGAVVDNVSSGGITAVIDPDTGVIISDAVDKRGNTYLEHPDTHVTFKGFQIPEWDSLKKLAYDAHSVISFYPYVGWDFALSETGWVIVEANWGNFISQHILKKGIRDEFEKCFKRI